MTNGDKFAPQPPPITIRTMQTDEEALRSGGGQMPPAALPVEDSPSPPPSAPEPFLALGGSRPEPPAPPPIPSAPRPLEGPEVLAGGIAPRPSARGAAATGGPPPGKGKNIFLIVGIVVAALLALGAAGYFALPLIVPRASPSPTPPLPEPLPLLPSPIVPSPSPSPTPSPAPPILFNPPYERQVATDLPSLTPAALLDALKAEAQSAQATGTVTNMVFTLNHEMVGAEALAGAFAPNAPPDFSAALSGSYIIALVYKKDIEPHAGIVLGLKGDIEAVKTLFRNWESSTLEKDFSFLFLEKTIGARKDPEFKDANFGGASLRYANYESPAGYAFDYAFLTRGENQYVVLTTSREPLFELIRRLQ